VIVLSGSDIDDVVKFISKLEYDQGKKIFLQRVYLDLHTACKLHILSFLEERSRSDISRKAIQRMIEDYEKKYGNLINIVKRDILMWI
jgi:hypothetical protein